MKTKIINFIVLLVLITSCGTRGGKITEENFKQQQLIYVHRNMTNILTQLTSGYIETSNDTLKGEMNVVQSIIRLPESNNFDLTKMYIDLLIYKRTDLGLSIYQPWTRDTKRSYTSYNMGLMVNKSTANFIFIFYTEQNGEKKLTLYYFIK